MIRLILTLSFMLLLTPAAIAQKKKSLVGNNFEFQLEDTAFHSPYIDKDEIRKSPVRHRYVHGGFSNGTKFSFYFPDKKAYEGHFFQYVAPFPDSEVTLQEAQGSYNMIGFAVSNGAYIVETNGGGKTDFTTSSASADPTIGAYRAHAASAEFSRLVAKKIFGGKRPYGYVYGGSGGAYRTLGCIENTHTWDGAVPYVLGSPVAIPNVFAVRMNALRVLKNKLPQIVDALEPGGSGNPYAGLNQEEYQTLREATAMGFPLRSWYGWNQMDAHGFMVLYKSVVDMDSNYFRHDFWNEHGYLGANPTPSLVRDRVQLKAKVVAVYTQDEAEQLGIVEPMNPEDRGSADRAWEAAGLGKEGMPVAFKLDSSIPDIGFGGDLLVLNQKERTVLQIKSVKEDAVVLAPTNSNELLALVKVGDSVMVDNSDFLAVQTYYRHQVPSKEFYVWDYLKDGQGNPLYPQRPMQLGPIFTRGAAGCLPLGKPNGKIILCCSLFDREAFPWQGDWYRRKVEENLGADAESNFRLWYTDKALHGDVESQLDDPTHAISYNGVLQQALLDISAWVEKGIEPAQTTNYKISHGQVELPATAEERQGIQPAVDAFFITENGDTTKMAVVEKEQPVTIYVKATVPSGQGKVVSAEWSLDGKTYTDTTDLKKHGTYSPDSSTVEFSHTVRYKDSSDHFVTVKITSQRGGKIQKYTQILNLDRVRVRVK